MQHLEAREVLTEPKAGRAEIPNAGAVLAVRPRLVAVVSLAPDAFGLLASMMLLRRLASSQLSFQEPRYGKALVASFSFSTQSPGLG